MEVELSFNSETQDCHFTETHKETYIFKCMCCNYIVMDDDYDKGKEAIIRHGCKKGCEHFKAYYGTREILQ